MNILRKINNFRIIEEEYIFNIKDGIGEIYSFEYSISIQIKCNFLFIPFWKTIKCWSIINTNDDDKEFLIRESNELLDEIINF